MSSETFKGIDGHSIVVLVTFLLVNILIVFPLRIYLPRIVSRVFNRTLVALRLDDPPELSANTDELSAPKERGRLVLGLNTAPVLGVLICLTSLSINWEVVKRGIVGDGKGVKPYDIMLLFISLAYISISLDVTGLLRYLAFLVSQKGGSSGFSLYASLYAFFFVCGMVVGNDPIVLSGTGFLVYFTRVTGVSPAPWIIAQFAAANIASAVLVSSNPTNLVLSSAFEIPFQNYTAWVILPSIAAIVAGFPVLYWVEFRGDVPKSIDAVDVEPGRALVDPKGAWFGSILLAATLIVLVAGSATGIIKEVWKVTVPAALVMLIRDISYDIHQSRKGRLDQGPPITAPFSPAVSATPGGETLETIEMDNITATPQLSQGPPVLSEGDIVDQSTTNAVPPERSEKPSKGSSTALSHRRASYVDFAGDQSETVSVQGDPTASRPPSVTMPARRRVSLPSILDRLAIRFPTSASTFKHLPFPLLPPVFSLFILVEGLAASGWSRVFAGWWAAWVAVTGVYGCVFGMCFFSVVLCNIVGTNIGACVLVTSSLQSWIEVYSPPENQKTAAIYALALGSNLGAVSFTFSASLAGLLWRRILLQKGINMGATEFARSNYKILAVSIVVASSVLLGEVLIMLPSS